MTNKTKQSKSFWLYFTFSEIFLIRRIMVRAEKLKPENNFISSKHTVSTAAIIHFFTKSPSVNGLFSIAVNCATM